MARAGRMKVRQPADLPAAGDPESHRHMMRWMPPPGSHTLGLKGGAMSDRPPGSSRSANGARAVEPLRAPRQRWPRRPEALVKTRQRLPERARAHRGAGRRRQLPRDGDAGRQGSLRRRRAATAHRPGPTPSSAPAHRRGKVALARRRPHHPRWQFRGTIADKGSTSNAFATSACRAPGRSTGGSVGPAHADRRHQNPRGTPPGPRSCRWTPCRWSASRWSPRRAGAIKAVVVALRCWCASRPRSGGGPACRAPSTASRSTRTSWRLPGAAQERARVTTRRPDEADALAQASAFFPLPRQQRTSRRR